MFWWFPIWGGGLFALFGLLCFCFAVLLVWSLTWVVGLGYLLGVWVRCSRCLGWLLGG